MLIWLRQLLLLLLSHNRYIWALTWSIHISYFQHHSNINLGLVVAWTDTYPLACQICPPQRWLRHTPLLSYPPSSAIVAWWFQHGGWHWHLPPSPWCWPASRGNDQDGTPLVPWWNRSCEKENIKQTTIRDRQYQAPLVSAGVFHCHYTDYCSTHTHGLGKGTFFVALICHSVAIINILTSAYIFCQVCYPPVQLCKPLPSVCSSMAKRCDVTKCRICHTFDVVAVGENERLSH